MKINMTFLKNIILASCLLTQPKTTKLKPAEGEVMGMQVTIKLKNAKKAQEIIDEYQKTLDKLRDLAWRMGDCGIVVECENEKQPDEPAAKY